MKIDDVRLLIGPEILPSDHTHMSGPYLIEMKDHHRLFFTSRCFDGAGRVRSSPFYLDLDKENLQPIGALQPIQLRELGLGSYREHGVFPFSVFPFGGHGALMALATGWQRREDVDVETAIGVLFSLDGGQTWLENSNGPRWSAQRNEPFLVCDASFLEVGNEKLLAYAFGVDWKEDSLGIPQRRYMIGVSSASHFDALTNGEGASAIPAVIEEEVQAYPNLLSQPDGSVLMTFCWRDRIGFRVEPKKGYRLGFAQRDSSNEWSRMKVEDATYPHGAESMQCYPSFFRVGESVKILFNGNNFGSTGIFVGELKGIPD